MMRHTPLEEDHEAVGKLVEELRAALRSGASVRTVYELLDAVWARLAVHIRAEHLCLFPAVLETARGLSDGQRDGHDAPSRAQAEAVVERLHGDHDFFMRELAAAVNTLRGLLLRLSAAEGFDARAEVNGVRRAIEAVAARLEEHNALEERQVYRWAELLPPEEATQLAAGIRRELANLPPRFNDRRGPA